VQTFVNPAAEPEERANLVAEARQAAQQALLLEPNGPYANFASAFIAQFYWNWAEADQAYERALETSPNNPGLLFWLARLRSFQRRHEEAIELMQRVVQLWPSAGSSYFVLASVIAHSGDPEAALAPAREAVKLSAGNPVTHLWLARIGSALDLDDEVAEHLSIAERLSTDTATPVGLASLAFTYSRIGHEEDASRILAQLNAATPDRDFNAGSWVMGYLAQGDEDAAYEALQTVVDRVERNEPDAAYWPLMIVKSNAQRHPVLDTPRFEDLRNRIGTSN
jgi:tetratricopeptide (TPR) repeat protein